MTHPVAASDVDYERRFGGLARLYRDAGLQRLQAAHVTVVGLGGVGSWAAESLARTGIGQMTLIDLDVVAESNINRQLPALSTTLGRNKIEVMAERIRQINPAIQLTLIDDFLTQDNLTLCLAGQPDVVLDCCDDFRAKVSLAVHAYFNRLPLIVAGAAGGKMDPTQVRVDDLARTQNDPLLAKLRQHLRQQYGLKRNLKERFGLRCVYSAEPLYRPTDCQVSGLQCGGYGSVSMVTGAFGLAAAAEAVRQLVKAKTS